MRVFSFVFKIESMKQHQQHQIKKLVPVSEIPFLQQLETSKSNIFHLLSGSGIPIV
jgi:hypothetical protein